MIKRDTIQRYAAIVTQDEIGGTIVERMRPEEIIPANVSIGTFFKHKQVSFKEVNYPEERDQVIINVVTNIKLDEYLYTRYRYSNKMFKITRQIKQGNEYFSTLAEVNEEVPIDASSR